MVSLLSLPATGAGVCFCGTCRTRRPGLTFDYSGLVLTENLFSFGSLEDLGRPAQTTVDCCATLARFPGCDGEIWDQDAISPFAFSYPKLNKAEGKRLSQLLTTEDPEHEEIHDMKAEPVSAVLVETLSEMV